MPSPAPWRTSSTVSRRGGAASSARGQRDRHGDAAGVVARAPGSKSALAMLEQQRQREHQRRPSGATGRADRRARAALDAGAIADAPSSHDERDRQPAEPARREPVRAPAQPAAAARGRSAVDEPGPAGVVVGGDDQAHRLGRRAACGAVAATTFWLARSGVSRRPSETPMSASAITETSATRSSAPPSRGDATASRLPASAEADVPARGPAPSSAGTRRARSVTSRPLGVSSSASQRAARRSASDPAPRRLEAVERRRLSRGWRMRRG